MTAITTIKNTGLDTFIVYNSKNVLIATASKQKDNRYLIAIFGGKLHGKIAYAQDWQDLNDKSVEISKIH